MKNFVAFLWCVFCLIGCSSGSIFYIGTPTGGMKVSGPLDISDATVVIPNTSLKTLYVGIVEKMGGEWRSAPDTIIAIEGGKSGEFLFPAGEAYVGVYKRVMRRGLAEHVPIYVYRTDFCDCANTPMVWSNPHFGIVKAPNIMIIDEFPMEAVQTITPSGTINTIIQPEWISDAVRELVHDTAVNIVTRLLFQRRGPAALPVPANLPAALLRQQGKPPEGEKEGEGIKEEDITPQEQTSSKANGIIDYFGPNGEHLQIDPKNLKKSKKI